MTTHPRPIFRLTIPEQTDRFTEADTEVDAWRNLAGVGEPAAIDERRGEGWKMTRLSDEEAAAHRGVTP